MTKPVLREAYDNAVADGATPGYWGMSFQTHTLLKMDGQDFCGLPVNENPAMPLGDWTLYPTDMLPPRSANMANHREMILNFARLHGLKTRDTDDGNIVIIP